MLALIAHLRSESETPLPSRRRHDIAGVWSPKQPEICALQLGRHALARRPASHDVGAGRAPVARRSADIASQIAVPSAHRRLADGPRTRQSRARAALPSQGVRNTAWRLHGAASFDFHDRSIRGSGASIAALRRRSETQASRANRLMTASARDRDIELPPQTVDQHAWHAGRRPDRRRVRAQPAHRSAARALFGRIEAVDHARGTATTWSSLKRMNCAMR